MHMTHLINFYNYIQNFNIVSILIRVFMAILLGGLVGLERSKSGRAAGLRTHILVCLGATIAAMTGLHIDNMSGSGDVSRIAAQVISGIGFLGAGTILVKNKSTVTGLTTAACVWAVGTIGVAIGYGFYEAAILGAFLIFFITKTLNAVDRKVRPHSKVYEVYVEILDVKKSNDTIREICDLGIDVDVTCISDSKASAAGAIGLSLWLHVHKDVNIGNIVDKINNLENVHFAIMLMNS